MMNRLFLIVVPLALNLCAEVRYERVPEGGIQPQIVQEESGRVHMIYFKGDPRGGNIFYVTKKSAKESFSKPIQVNRQEGSAIAIGTMRGPQLAVGKNSRAHISWMGGSGAAPVKIGSQDATPMMYARLAESGSEFEPEKAVNRLVSGLDGGGSVAADEKGNVWVIWHGSAPGVEGEENRALYVAVSSDEGKDFAPEFKAKTEKPGACACCGMKALAGEDGKLYVLYRGVEEQVKRPELFLESSDAGRSFQTIYSDLWKSSTCPASTVSAQARNGRMVSAWETAGNVYSAMVRDGKESDVVSPAGGGKRKFPFAIANRKGEVLLTWVEGAGWERAGTVAWEIFKDGRSTGEKGTGKSTPVWSFGQAYEGANGGFVVVY